MKIAVICHIYKSDIFWDDIEPRLKNLNQEFDLYISMTDNFNRENDIKRLKDKYPSCYIGLVPNVGEDLRGFFHCLNHIFAENKEYDAVLKLHTKTNDIARKEMLNTVLCQDISYKYTLMTEKSFGMYGCKKYRFILNKENINKYTEKQRQMWFYHDKQNMIDICKRMRCKTLCWDFFGGTIFWINFQVLKKYFGNNQITEDYFFEPYATGGLRAHAGERIFGCICHNEKRIVYDETTFKKVNVCIVHFNTPELTTALVKSIYKFTPQSNIYIFDNSDKHPFPIDEYPEIHYYDNTKGQIIDFEEWLNTYPKKMDTFNGSRFGSAKHSYTIQWLIDNLPEDDFVLMDSDILLKKDFSNIIDSNQLYVGDVSNVYKMWQKRIIPFLCYINKSLCINNNIQFFNGEFMVNLTDNKQGLLYDTGAYFYMELLRNGRFSRVKFDEYAVHFNNGSWIEFSKIAKKCNQYKTFEYFLKKYENLWK